VTDVYGDFYSSRYHANGTSPQLEADEDAELRRLHVLRGFGMVAGTVSSRYEALRGRDRRNQVREPDDAKIAAPVERDLWTAEQTSQARLGAPETTSAPPVVLAVSSPSERVISDTREIFGELPKSRRGRGIFRR
jgi:hypothetical protein